MNFDYDSSDATILPYYCYEGDVPILLFYLKIVMKVLYRFYDSFDTRKYFKSAAKS